LKRSLSGGWLNYFGWPYFAPMKAASQNLRLHPSHITGIIITVIISINLQFGRFCDIGGILQFKDPKFILESITGMWF
jgi:hypothetical protein